MNRSLWCEHEEKTSKISTVKYNFDDKEIQLIVQTWMCPLCGVHGSTTAVADRAEG
ncbi:hypothetical protein [Sporomusa sp. KB1]|jgi:hypothetical protein|uniref:hypothetical protein n=1 Tax=Sporomusa sp. KB1 TaxID=943346 RepID=UPI0011ABB121|nr:hypothetical protein [Sporomusa sp. KB1]TWH52088.1 hypothetical protein Salpa_0598 [Sporomusa sp. KB1]